MLRLKRPLDHTAYDRDPRSQTLTAAISDGRYVYAIDARNQIWILPDDGPHLHPKILGKAQPARYAGEVVITAGEVIELTNCSGTFQFRSQRGLLETARLMEKVGLEIAAGSVVYHYFDRISRPRILPYRPENFRD